MLRGDHISFTRAISWKTVNPEIHTRLIHLVHTGPYLINFTVFFSQQPVHPSPSLRTS